MRQCVLETTPVSARVKLLNSLARSGSKTRGVAILAARVLERAQYAARDAPRRGSWRERILAMEALREVHRLPYVADPIKEDCYKDVDLTIAQGGECKALNILLAAILLRLGVQVEVWWITQTGKPLNHVASVVWLDGKPLWADASIRGAMLGESPYHALERTGAYHIVGGKAREPVATTAAAAGVADPPFEWEGWHQTWYGWPSSWWKDHYPHLYRRDYFPARFPACDAYNEMCGTPRRA